MNEENTIPYDAGYLELASAFHCGHPYLDSFLKNDLALNPYFGKTYIWLSSDKKSIIGYYNITTGSVYQITGNQTERLGGSIHINCFALHDDYKGVEFGKTEFGDVVRASDMLLQECISRIQRILDDHVGFSFITLCSTKEGYHLYQRHGFLDLEQDMLFHTNDKDIKTAFMYYPLEYE